MTVKSIKFADFKIALNSNADQGNFSIPDNYSQFISSGDPNIVLKTHQGSLPDMSGWGLSFKTSGPVCFFCNEDSWMVTISTQTSGESPEVAAKFSTDNHTGDIYDTAPQTEDNKLPFPLRYPLGEIFLADLLSQGSGLIMHACGIIRQGRGIIFSGTSGAGKSTIARLFSKADGFNLLNDDRVILTEENGEIRLYGTPWHGEIKQVSAQDAPLKKVFVLNQAEQNRIIPLKPIEAATALFVRAFPTYWKPSGIEYSLQFLENLVRDIPCYRLDFTPGPELVELII